MSITRLRPDAPLIFSRTVPLTSAPGFSQVFDLGQIRVAYAEMTLISQDPDGLTLGTGAGQVYWWAKKSDGGGTPEQSRAGVDYVPFDTTGGGGASLYTGGALPSLMFFGSGIVTRYLKAEAHLWDVDTNLPYAGAQNPTADWSVYVEYV